MKLVNIYRLISISISSILPLVAAFYLSACGSGGPDNPGSSSSEETGNSSEPLPSNIFLVEPIPNIREPVEQPMSRKGASTFVLYTMRLLSAANRMLETEIYGSNHFNIAPLGWDLEHKSGRNEKTNCEFHGSEETRPAQDLSPNAFKILYQNCIKLANSGDKPFFDGEVIYDYERRDFVKTKSFVDYRNLHTQYGREELELYGTQRGEVFYGTINVETLEDNTSIEVDLRLQNNIIGTVVFDKVKIVQSTTGEIISAGGSLGISGEGKFGLSSKNGVLVLGDEEDHHLNIRFVNRSTVLASYHGENDRVYGNYYNFEFIQSYDSRNEMLPIERDSPKEEISKESVSYFDQEDIINISLSRHYTSLDGSLLSYDLELLGITASDRIYGRQKVPGFLPLSAVREFAKPQYTVTQNEAGMLQLVVHKLPGARNRLRFRAKITAENGEFSDASEFEVWVHGDFDMDGVNDSLDLDDDNDGVADIEDALPYDNRHSNDTDGDGIGDGDDPDIDDDGVVNEQDYFPFDSRCYLQFSGTEEGICLTTLSSDIASVYKGVSPNGIAVFWIASENTAFRYDLEKGVFYPPIIISDVSQTFPIVRVDQSSNYVLLQNNLGSLLLFDNVPEPVLVNTVVKNTPELDLAINSTTLTIIKEGILQVGNQNSDNRSQTIYLFNKNGDLVDSLPTDETWIRYCPENANVFYKKCLLYEDNILFVRENSDAPAFTPQPTDIFSPKRDYLILDKRIYSSAGDSSYTFASNVIAWTDVGVVTLQPEALGVWDFDRQKYIHYSKLDANAKGIVIHTKNTFYQVFMDNNQHFTSREITIKDDFDQDGVLDEHDDFPFDSRISKDSDGDGYADSFNIDNANYRDIKIDAFPENAACWDSEKSCGKGSLSYVGMLNEKRFVNDNDVVLISVDNDIRLIHRFSKNITDFISPIRVRPKNIFYPSTFIFKADDWTYVRDVNRIYFTQERDMLFIDMNQLNPTVQYYVGLAEGESHESISTITRNDGIIDTYLVTHWQSGPLQGGLMLRSISDPSKRLRIPYPTAAIESAESSNTLPLSSFFWSSDSSTFWFSQKYGDKLYICRLDYNYSEMDESICSEQFAIEANIDLDIASWGPFVKPGEFTISPTGDKYSFKEQSGYLGRANEKMLFSEPREIFSRWLDDGRLIKHDKFFSTVNLFDFEFNILNDFENENVKSIIEFSDGDYVISTDGNNNIEMMPLE